MTCRKFLAFSFAAVLLSTSFAAVAATTPSRHGRHSSTHKAHMTKPSNRAAAPNADHSADSLNGQSLSRTQGGQ